MTAQDSIARIDQEVSAAVHKLVASDEADREARVRALDSLLSERARLSRPPVIDRIEQLLRARV